MHVDFVRAIDKLHKIGEDGVKEELRSKGHEEEKIKDIDIIKTAGPTKNLEGVFSILDTQYHLKKDSDFYFDPTLARGLDYYTGIVIELKPEGNPQDQSAGGGGRYDKLIGMFAGRDIPAVGFSFGIDRLAQYIK